MESDDIAQQLKRALEECSLLREENKRLRLLLCVPEEKPNAPATRNLSLDDKITLFRSLFRGREDVYPVRWEAKTGKSGYSPACANEWKRPLCTKPRMKCSDCDNRELVPVTDEAIQDHLTGKHTIGVYPLLPDETCWFLAVDFDKTTWKEDVAAFLKTCEEMGVPIAFERSRSGNGVHAWIFFDSLVQAVLARKLGSAILTYTMERHPQLGFDSYDRFFPSQDTMPKGGFGSLIALPLQRIPRDKGNSLFLDKYFNPYPDQWAFLAGVRKMRKEEIEAIVYEAQRNGKIVGVRMSLTEEGNEDPWTLPPSGRKVEKTIEGPFPAKVGIVVSNMVYIEKGDLPAGMINKFIRLAAFQNPEFYKTQAMRLSTYGKPRIISCAEDFEKHIGLPRGCLDEALELLKAHGIRADIRDERFSGMPVEADFNGELRPMQKEAVSDLLKHDIGVLSAPTAFGKTTMAAYIIAERKINDLIFDDLLSALEKGCSPLLLTERTEHVDNFAERLKGFAKNIIVLKGGAGKKQRMALAEQMASIPEEEERVLIATGRYIGEGFDDARLDTLFLTMPISWRGTLQQYAGRLHRLHDNKKVVRIYDYVDVNLPMLTRMYEKRLKGYKAIGYSIQDVEEEF